MNLSARLWQGAAAGGECYTLKAVYVCMNVCINVYKVCIVYTHKEMIVLPETHRLDSLRVSRKGSEDSQHPSLARNRPPPVAEAVGAHRGTSCPHSAFSWSAGKRGPWEVDLTQSPPQHWAAEKRPGLQCVPSARRLLCRPVWV